MARAIERGRFPWVALEYDERMQVERSVQRWSVAVAAETQVSKDRRGARRLRRSGSRGD